MSRAMSRASGVMLSAVMTTFVGKGASSLFHVPSKQKTSRFIAPSMDSSILLIRFC
jgi:hypothetical protein